MTLAAPAFDRLKDKLDGPTMVWPHHNKQGSIV